jgi:hypothetical protein
MAVVAMFSDDKFVSLARNNFSHFQFVLGRGTFFVVTGAGPGIFLVVGGAT